jgi:hypothetical protein
LLELVEEHLLGGVTNDGFAQRDPPHFEVTRRALTTDHFVGNLEQLRTPVAIEAPRRRGVDRSESHGAAIWGGERLRATDRFPLLVTQVRDTSGCSSIPDAWSPRNRSRSGRVLGDDKHRTSNGFDHALGRAHARPKTIGCTTRSRVVERTLYALSGVSTNDEVAGCLHASDQVDER